MLNNYNELDELFSSSNEEGQSSQTTPLTIISSQVSSNLETIQDELFEQMILEKEVEQEESIILKELQIECMENQLLKEQVLESETSNELPDCKSTKKYIQFEIEFDRSEKDSFTSSENELVVSTIVPRIADSGESVFFPLDKQIFIDSCIQKIDEIKLQKKNIKEAEDSKYFVEPIGPKPDFSIHGDFAEIMELDYANKLKEYNQKVEAMKKLKAEDQRIEKIRKENEKREIAKARVKLKIERTIKKLQNQIYKFGHYAEVVGYNDSHSVVKLAIPRTYHRIIDNRGYILKTAPFIEISKTRDTFYCYNYKLDRFELYANFGEETNGKFKLIKIAKTQNEMWKVLEELDPITKLGYTFEKFDHFDSCRYY